MIPGTLSTRAGRGFVLVFTALAAVEVLGSVAEVGSSIPFKFGILQVLLCCLCAPAAAQQTLPWRGEKKGERKGERRKGKESGSLFPQQGLALALLCRVEGSTEPWGMKHSITSLP